MWLSFLGISSGIEKCLRTFRSLKLCRTPFDTSNSITQRFNKLTLTRLGETLEITSLPVVIVTPPPLKTTGGLT